MQDEDSSFNLISLNILITCLLDNVRLLKGEVSFLSLLRVKGLKAEVNPKLNHFK